MLMLETSPLRLAVEPLSDPPVDFAFRPSDNPAAERIGPRELPELHPAVDGGTGQPRSMQHLAQPYQTAL